MRKSIKVFQFLIDAQEVLTKAVGAMALLVLFLCLVFFAIAMIVFIASIFV